MHLCVCMAPCVWCCPDTLCVYATVRLLSWAGNGAKDKAGTRACQWDVEDAGDITDASCNKYDACSQETGETGCKAASCEWSDNTCFSKDDGGGKPGEGGGTGKEAVRVQVCAQRK